MSVEFRPAVLVSKADFDSLPEYSCSIPTGALPGKWWKRRRRYDATCNEWLLGVYADKPNPDRTVTIYWRRLEWYPWIEDGKPENADDLPKRRTKWAKEEIRDRC